MARYVSKADLVYLLGDEETCLQFLFDEGLLNARKLCSECNAPMTLKKRADRRFPYFTCGRGHEKLRIACTKGTWFENARMSPLQIMLLTHCFSTDNSYKQTEIEASVGDTKLSQRTITEWFNFCREVCMISMEDKYNSRGKIGGPGHVEEIDHVVISSKIYMVRRFAAYLTVNYSHHFVHPVTGVYTNTIESQWRLSLLIK